MGAPRHGPLTAMVVTLLVVSSFGPLLIASAATDMFPGTVYRGTLSTLNDRDDYNFTAMQNEWTLVASNRYQGVGNYRHGLRTNISAKNPFVSTYVGQEPTAISAGVLAINGYDLPADTDYTVSQELAFSTPSYALQLRTGMPTLSRNSQTISESMGTDGVARGWEISLQKRDTLHLRLTVPPEWTYNYYLNLLLFGPNGRYHQYSGDGGTNPEAESDAGENIEQAFTYLAMDPGTYLIVVLNRGTLDDIMFDLDVSLNGWPLNPGDLDENSLNRINSEEFYTVDAPGSSWSATVAKVRDAVDGTFTHSLHWPTADSNTIAKDELDDDSPVGIIAINGRELVGSDTYYVREMYEVGKQTVPFTIQFDTPIDTITSPNTTVGSLTSSQIFNLYEFDLQASQTADLRLQVAPEYNYDHDLGLYVFPPGDKYYSVSGQLSAYASGPIAMSRAGQNTEQSVVFTSPIAGTYAVIIVNFAARDDIPFTLETTIQGRALANNVPLVGDLNEQNSQDQYRFVAQTEEWNLVGSRPLTDEGGQWHQLMGGSLDTNPIRTDGVGEVPIPGATRGETRWEPTGLLAVDGHQLTGPTTYFIREEVVEGSPIYMVELQNSHTDLTAQQDNLSATFRASEYLHTYVVDLQERDTIDLRTAPPPEHTYPYHLGVYVFAPGELYRNLDTEGDAAAMSVPGEARDPTIFYTASTTGQHLVVVANLGSLESLEYELTYAVNGFRSSIDTLNTGSLDEDNQADAYRFDAMTHAYTMLVVRLPDEEPAATVEASLRWPTIDSVALSRMTLTAEDRVGAFVLNGDSLPVGSVRHFVVVTADVPGGTSVPYHVQVGYAYSGLPNATQNLSGQEIGDVWSVNIVEGSTVDLALRMAPDYTYSYDLGLYLFAPDMPYMNTLDPEVGPRARSVNGPGTEQEIIFTSRASVEHGIVVLNKAALGDLSFTLTATVNGRPLDKPLGAYVDQYNQNEQYRFTTDSNTWAVLASSHISGTGVYDLKLLSKSLSTNPVAMVPIDAISKTGVIAINGWQFDEASKTMFANVSHDEGGRSVFVVNAETNGTDFGPIGHTESGQFIVNQVAYIFLVDLVPSDTLEIQLAYDQGNWSSDVNLQLQIFQPLEEIQTEPVGTVDLVVTSGYAAKKGFGTFTADLRGTYAFVLVNRGSLGPMGFSMGVYRRSIADLPPMYPSILSATSTTDSITVEWALNQESNFDRYEVWLSTVSNDPGNKVDTITTQTLSKYTITGLDPGHKYYITIVTHNDAGLDTASDPYAVSTKDLPLYQEPIFWVLVLTIVVAIVAIVGIDWFIRKQKAATAATSEAGAEAAVGGGPPGAGVEVEGMEEDTTIRKEAPRAPADEASGDRTEAVDFMRQMMGDEE